MPATCRYRRYVVEDRWTAVRWAIGTARDKDIVIIAGRGHTDYQEWMADDLTYRVCPPMGDIYSPAMPAGPVFILPQVQGCIFLWLLSLCDVPPLPNDVALLVITTILAANPC